MKETKSFVRRNSRMTDSHKQHMESHAGYLHSVLPIKMMTDADFVGLEVGFGMGDSLLDVASKNSQHLWIGIEVYEIGVSSVIRQSKEDMLENIVVMVGDATELLAGEQAHKCFDHIRVFFPDPWPKKRHLKRRLLQQAFIDHLADLLKPGGVLHIATDNLNYAEGCLDILSKSQSLTLMDQVPHRPLTKFARKAIEKGVVITDIAARKADY